MQTFYTAMGRYEMRRGPQGQRQPVLKLRGEEFYLDGHEQVLWGSLLWEIREKEALREIYRKKVVSMGLGTGDDFQHYIDRLVTRGLVAAGTAEVGEDALYALLGHLSIIPLSMSLPIKLLAVVPLLLRGTPLRAVLRTFRRVPMTRAEKRVLALVRQQVMSTAEVIRCMDRGVVRLPTEESVLEALYDDDYTTCDNITELVRNSDCRISVLEAVSNLCLKTLVIFERY